MAKNWHYRITTAAPGTNHETIHHPADGSVWTSETAQAWARAEGASLPVGTKIAIDRRGARGGLYRPHRRYVVEETGVRRTDRTPSR